MLKCQESMTEFYDRYVEHYLGSVSQISRINHFKWRLLSRSLRFTHSLKNNQRSSTCFRAFLKINLTSWYFTRSIHTTKDRFIQMILKNLFYCIASREKLWTRNIKWNNIKFWKFLLANQTFLFWNWRRKSQTKNSEVFMFLQGMVNSLVFVGLQSF